MLKIFTKKKGQKGFTLIELIVVIAILGILAAIALPKLGGFQENAKRSSDEGFARAAAHAVDMYNAANDPDITAGAVSGLSNISGMVNIATTFKSTKYSGTPTLVYVDGNATITNGAATPITVWAP